MPLRKSIAERIDEARIVIKTALIRNNKMAKDIEERKIMKANTFYVKQAKTDRLKLSDLWRLDDMLHFTNEEILQMFGRKGWLNWWEQLTACEILGRYALSIREAVRNVRWVTQRTYRIHLVRVWRSQTVGRMKKQPKW